jgi:hypothetical protein
MRADRIHFAPGNRQAALRQRTFADLAFRRAQASARFCPLLVSGAFDRRAIMRLAMAAAKARRAVTDEGWRICVSAALQGTWQAAKSARLMAGWNANRPVVNIDETSVRIGPKPTMPVVRPNAALQDADTSSGQSPRVPLSSNSCPLTILPARNLAHVQSRAVGTNVISD